MGEVAAIFLTARLALRENRSTAGGASGAGRNRWGERSRNEGKKKKKGNLVIQVIN